MIADSFLKFLQKEFPHPLTSKQQEAALEFVKFLYSDNPLSMFILRGYAGTGKTTLVAAIVRVLHKLRMKTILLAPTGRAAKVFSLNAGFPAYTIHKEIYRQKTMTSEDSHFDLDRNTNKDALFIIDEASMISGLCDSNSIFGSGSLLRDLLIYVYKAPGCRIMFVGDNAQLPPVGENQSVALTPSALKEFHFNISGFQLLEVMRQKEASGILHNATLLRTKLRENEVYDLPKLETDRFSDIVIPNGDEMLDALENSYAQEGTDQTIVITRTNKQANEYNQGIRSHFFNRESELEKGDIIMAVRNNYFWAEQEAIRLKNIKSSLQVPMDFIANGDIAEVINVNNEYEFYGLHFADVRLRFTDYNGFEMNLRVLLDALHSEGPSITHEQEQMLFQGVLADYADERRKKDRMKKIRLDPNYNALQIKYAYAVTCHKAQGGQWNNVFLDQGWIPQDAIDQSYYRWLYTAITRPTQKLYLLRWPKEQINNHA